MRLLILSFLIRCILADVGISRPCNSRWQEIIVRNKWGYLYSPNYGHGSYYPADTCYWLLTSADPNLRIRVIFQSFKLQDRVSNECDDYVVLYDGRRETAPQLGTYCGHKPPRAVVSSGRNMLLKFVADDELQFPGFRVLYETFEAHLEEKHPNHLFDQLPTPSTSTTASVPSMDDDGFSQTLVSLTCPDQTASQVSDLLRYVPDSKLTASSSWRNHPPWLARLDNKATSLAACCWAAENSADDSSYIQAEFSEKKMIRAIVTQGSDILDEWVTSYRLAYGLNGGDFTYYKTYDGKIKLFRANKNAQGKSLNVLEPPVVAKFVRLLPQTAHRWKTLRWGVFGCNSTTPAARSHFAMRHRISRPAQTTMAAPKTTTPQTPAPPIMHQVFAEEAPAGIFSLDSANSHNFAASNPALASLERCRGAVKLLTEPRGRITSPNFGEGQNYPPRDACTWQIFARDDQRIKVVFEILAIEDSYNCQRDFVALYDGPTVNSPPLGKFCGTELPPMLVTSGNQLTIFFNSGDTVQASGFALTYYFQQDRNFQNGGYDSTIIMPTLPMTTVDNTLRCDDRIVIVHGLTGKIESPGYGRAQYLPDDMCNWRIVAPEHRRIRVVFQDFDLSPGIGPGGRCEDEYLSVYDGSTDASRLLGSFCGSNIPPSIISTGPALFLRFASGAPNGQRAGLRAVFSTLEEDFLTTRTPVRTTLNDRRPLKFTNEDDAEALYREEGRCEGQIKIMTQHEGSFWSPRYPSNTYYPQDLCFWLIRAPTGYRIRFFFDALALELAPRCAVDNLTLYDGDRDSAPLLGYFCGFETPNESFLTSGQFLMVKFASGYSNSLRRTGFRINYRFINDSLALPDSPLKLNSFVGNEFSNINELPIDQAATEKTPAEAITAIPTNLGRAKSFNGCHGVKNLLTGDKGVVVSPNFGTGPYWASDTCYWEIRTVPSKRIRLGFQVFKVSWSPDCSRDKLIIYDGSSELSRILGTYCGNTLPLPVTSTINVLLLKFVTDSRQKTHEDIGFMALYGTLDYATPPPVTPAITTTMPPSKPAAPRHHAACNGSVSVLTGRSGVITSPDFAENTLPPSVMCFWEIRAPPSKRIQLAFETFAMPATEDCIGTHVALFIGSGSARPQIGRFCGDELPPKTISPGDRLFIRFVSGPYSVPGGFAAHYTLVDPIEDTTTTTTTTPSTTSTTTPTTTTTSTTTTTTPTTTTSSTTTSTTTTTTATTTTTTTKPSSTAPAFNVSAKCNDGRVVLTESKGQIKSPNFETGGRYIRGDSCWWQILLQPGSFIELKFRSFNVAESRGCSGDRLAVIDGPDARRSPTQTFCGHTPPADFRSSTNILTLHFTSQPGTELGGFGFVIDYAEFQQSEEHSPTTPPTTSTTAEEEEEFEYEDEEEEDTTTLPTSTATPKPTTTRQQMIKSVENVFAVDGSCDGKVFVLISEQRSATSTAWKRIASPNFSSHDGSSYKPNDVCFWKVISPDDSQIIELRVELIDLESPGDAGCPSYAEQTRDSEHPPPLVDMVTIFNGPDEGSAMLSQFCGEHRTAKGSGGARLMTSANQAFVKFTSGSASSSKKPAGFLIAYRAIPKITPMAMPPIVAQTTPKTTTTILTTTTTTTTSLPLPSTPRLVATKIAESANILPLQLQRCEGRLQIFSQDSGVISSPSYGGRSGYAASDSCLWEIIGRSGTKVQLVFKEFDVGIPPYPKVALNQMERCPSDRVVVYDGPGEYYPIQSTLCGRLEAGHSIMTTSNAAFVQFTSLPLTDGAMHAGFLLEYTIIGGSSLGTFGEEASPGISQPLQTAHSHQVFAEGPSVFPLLSDPVVKPLPPGVKPAAVGTAPLDPFWWCEDDLVAMLPDNAISASSERGEHHPKLVRDRRIWTPSPVELPCCWQPSDTDQNPFVQFDFGGPHMIGAARILDMRPVLPNVTHAPTLYLLVSESFESASDSRIPLTASETRINIKPPVVASKIRVYVVRQRTSENKLILPIFEHERPLIRISLFGCASPSNSENL